MSDFWIKIEKSTPDKPEIFEIAEILDIDPDAVMGKLVRAWSWIDSNSENGHIKSVTNVLLDRVTSCVGFADAMKTVGWLDDNDIPNFYRHLGKSAKKRANDAERKRKSRETSEECHKESVTSRGLDKSRVEKIKESNQESKIPSCPHQEIIKIYHEVLPELKSVLPERWAGSSRATNLQARWKEDGRHQDLEFWRAYFSGVRKSDWHMGNSGSWKADLGWLVTRSNFDKMVERIFA